MYDTGNFDIHSPGHCETAILYALACAKADRQESARYWQDEATSRELDPTRTIESVRSAETLASQARASVDVFNELADAYKRGVLSFVVTPERGVQAHTLPYNGDPADGTAPSHRDW